jgi:hypothetical protein
VVNFLLGSLFLLSSCSSLIIREEQKKLRSFFQLQQYQDALTYLQNSEGHQEDESRLLFLLEKGLLEHTLSQFDQSIASLNKARNLSQELFTSRLSKDIQVLIANDNYQEFYGETYERSLIHFYLALNNFLLYQENSTRRDRLFSSRAEILSWDSFLKARTNQTRGSSVYKDDLLAKIFGGFIHERLGTREENSIALQLYKDARKLLFRHYNAYKSFNKKYKSFIEHFEKLHTLELSLVESQFIKKTPFQQEIDQFLIYKILTVTKKLNRSLYQQYLKKLNPSEQMKRKLQKQDNVTVLLQRGLIPEKVPRVEYYPIALARPHIHVHNSSLIFDPSMGKNVLHYPPKDYSPYYYDWSSQKNHNIYGQLAVKFEIPIFKDGRPSERLVLRVLDFNGRPIKDEKLVLINPMGDLARAALAEKAASTYTRIGIRLATKYLTALAAFYATYQGLKEKLGQSLAMLIAQSELALTTSMIENSEKADLRYWATLPEEFRIASFHLPPGKYRLRALVKDSFNEDAGIKKSFLLGALEVKESDTSRLLNYRRPY